MKNWSLETVSNGHSRNLVQVYVSILSITLFNNSGTVWDMVKYFSLLVEFTCLVHQFHSLYDWPNHVSIKPWLSSMKALTFVLNVVCKTLYTSDFVELLWESSKFILWLYWLLFQDSPFALIIKDIWKHFVYWSILYFKPSLLRISIQRFFTSGYEIISSNEWMIHCMS